MMANVLEGLVAPVSPGAKCRVPDGSKPGAGSKGPGIGAIRSSCTITSERYPAQSVQGAPVCAWTGGMLMCSTTLANSTDSVDENTRAERPSRCPPGGVMPRLGTAPRSPRPEPHPRQHRGFLSRLGTRRWRGSPPRTSPPSRANLLRSDTDLSAAAPAASACPGPGARGAGRAVSGLSADRRGAPPESSPPAPGGLAPDRAAATGAGPAGAFGRLRPALFRAAACLVVAAAALLALPGGASAQENPVPVLVAHALGPVGRRPVPADIHHVDDRDATSSNIGVYNTFVQNRAAAGHMEIRAYSSQFRVVGSTAAVDARDNTKTTGTGVPIYWLNGAKVANNYADFYDGSWSNEANPKDESGEGSTVTGREPDHIHGKQGRRNRVFHRRQHKQRIGSNPYGLTDVSTTRAQARQSALRGNQDSSDARALLRPLPGVHGHLGSGDHRCERDFAPGRRHQHLQARRADRGHRHLQPRRWRCRMRRPTAPT